MYCVENQVCVVLGARTHGFYKFGKHGYCKMKTEYYKKHYALLVLLLEIFRRAPCPAASALLLPRGRLVGNL
jgi:hypothetical protein